MCLINIQNKITNDELEVNYIKTINALYDENNELKVYTQQLEDRVNELLQQKNQSFKRLGGSFKSYTDYRCLSRYSKQWKLQEMAYTDENGLRKIGDAYLVALGSYYGVELGSKYTVVLETGNTFEIILCDCKKDEHTSANNQMTLADGSILEFYVDTDVLPERVKTLGTIGSIDFFEGDIVNIVQIQ
jgi:hypothetical protein